MTWKLYIIHFNRSFHHARHYIGIAQDAKKRLKRHKAGDGSRLVRAVIYTDIKIRMNVIGEFEDFSTAHQAEKVLKKKHSTKKYCPICIKKEEKKKCQKLHTLKKDFGLSHIN